MISQTIVPSSTSGAYCIEYVGAAWYDNLNTAVNRMTRLPLDVSGAKFTSTDELIHIRVSIVSDTITPASGYSVIYSTTADFFRIPSGMWWAATTVLSSSGQTESVQVYGQVSYQPASAKMYMELSSSYNSIDHMIGFSIAPYGSVNLELHGVGQIK